MGLLYCCGSCLSTWPLNDQEADALHRQLHPNEVAILLRRESPPCADPTGCPTCRHLLELAQTAGDRPGDRDSDPETECERPGCPFCRLWIATKRLPCVLWRTFRVTYGASGALALVIWAAVCGWMLDPVSTGGSTSNTDAVLQVAMAAVASLMIGGALTVMVFAKRVQPDFSDHHQELKDLSDVAGTFSVITAIGFGLMILHLAGVSWTFPDDWPIIGVFAYLIVGWALIGLVRLVWLLSRIDLTKPPRPRRRGWPRSGSGCA